MKAMMLMAFAMMATGAWAGEAKVTYVEPEKFTDVISGYETDTEARSEVIKEFNGIFSRLSKRLPDGYELEVAVTDIDLAGQVRFNFRRSTRNYRVLKSEDWPRVIFSYSIKDMAQNVIASGNENLVDLDYLHQINTSNSRFKFEEQMLKDWFRRQPAVRNLSVAQK